MNPYSTEIDVQEVITAQKNLISDQQHQNLINQLAIKKLHDRVQQLEKELGEAKHELGSDI